MLLILILYANIGWADTVQVTASDIDTEFQESIQVPINISDVSGLGIISYDFTLTFDENVLDCTGAQLSGTLSQNFSPTVNTATDGQVTIVAYGTTPLSGSGVLLYLNFNVVGSAGSSTNLSFSSFMFNEGIPEANYDTPLAVVNIIGAEVSPIADFSADITSGNAPLTVQFTDESTAGTSPITNWQWDFDNDGTLDSSEENPIHTYSSLGTYSVKLQVTTAVGTDDTVKIDYITVSESPEGVQITAPNMSVEADANIQIPINISDVSGLGIISYDFTLTFDENVLDCTGAQLSGTLSQNFSPTVNTATDGQVTIVAYGTTPLSGSGVLLYLNFNVVGSAGSSTNLSFSSFMFNEGIPEANYDTPLNTVTIISFPSYDINTDGLINILDIQIIAANYGLTLPNYDLDGSGTIDINDIKILINHFGENQ